jgi:hypothetical protein
MTNRYIPAYVVDDLFWTSNGTFHESQPFEKTSMEEGDQTRWHRWNSLILRDTTDSTYWAIDWREGLTENQEDIYPWSGSDTAEAYQVYPHEKVTVEYY